MNTVAIILGCIILISIPIIIYIIIYNNIQAYVLKINESESIIDDLLRKKYDSLILIKDVIIEETKLDEKVFEDFKKVKDLNLSSFDFERKLTEFNAFIKKIKLDYPDLDSDTRFINYYDEIYQINEKLEGAKNYYNKYTNLLNLSIRKFPSNIIASINKIKVKAFFDGKDMFDNDLKDFKL